MPSKELLQKDAVRVLFNSSKRTYGTVESCQMTLSSTLKRVRRIRITDVQLPVTYYVFNTGNNILGLNLGGGETLTIAAGSYTPAALATYIAAQIAIQIPGMTTPTCTFNSNTRKFTIGSAVAFTVSGSAAPTLGFSTSTVATGTPKLATSDFAVYAETLRFNADNRSFVINDGIADRTLTLSAGNYTGSTLATELRTQMSDSGFFTAPITVSYLSGSFKFQISTGAAFTVKSSGTASAFLGFSANVASASNIATSNVIASNVGGPAYLYIKSKRLGDKKLTITYSDSSYSDVIHKLVISENFGGIVLDEAKVANPIYLAQHQDIDWLDFRLEFEDCSLVNLNGSDWSIGMVFELY